MIVSLKKQWLELVTVLILATITTIFFWDGTLDMHLAGLYFQPQQLDNPWPLQQFWLWRWLFDFGFPSTIIGGVISLAVYLNHYLRKSSTKIRQRALYCLLVIIIGPGLLVNMVLKEHWGRPRPREVIEFNGQYAYQPPTVLSNTGKHSFVCGHCSASYMFFAFYFILQEGRILALILTLAYAVLMGSARMAAGGHFVSDILWSGFVVFLVCWFLYYYLFRAFSPSSNNNTPLEINHNLNTLSPSYAATLSEPLIASPFALFKNRLNK